MPRQSASSRAIESAVQEGVQESVARLLDDVRRRSATLWQGVRLEPITLTFECPAPPPRRRKARRRDERPAPAPPAPAPPAPAPPAPAPPPSPDASSKEIVEVKPAPTPDEKWQRIEAERLARERREPPRSAELREPCESQDVELAIEEEIAAAVQDAPESASALISSARRGALTWEGAHARGVREAARARILAQRPVARVDPAEYLLAEWGAGWIRPSWERRVIAPKEES